MSDLVPQTARVQLVVTHADNSITYHQVGPGCGWRIDNPSRCIVVGTGMPRTYIPLDGVRCWTVETEGN